MRHTHLRLSEIENLLLGFEFPAPPSQTIQNPSREERHKPGDPEKLCTVVSLSSLRFAQVLSEGVVASDSRPW